MKELILKNGITVKVDDEDFERVSQFNWFSFTATSGQCRVARQFWSNGISKTVGIHRFIMNAKDGDIVDHKNGDTLDNRKENLRITDKTGNNQNRKIHKNNKCGYKGVCWDRGKWTAHIAVSGKNITLGRFTEVLDAARAYDAAAKKDHGEFARLNFG